MLRNKGFEVTRTVQIFLCYARQDEGRVSELYEKLSAAGFHPFMDTKDILPGEDWKLKLMNTIREAPFFLASLSNNSVDKRGVIQEEIREALDVWRQKLDSDIYLIPVRLEDCRVPGTLAKFQWVDLFQDGGFERLKSAINLEMEQLGIIRPIRLRSAPLDNLSEDDVKRMLQENDFYHKDWYWIGKGIRHQYELLRDGKIVFDQTTGLVWQHTGLIWQNSFAGFNGADWYIRILNERQFDGYNDWRLPTLEEAMSLMEPKKYGDLYIDPVFGRWRKPNSIWTADKFNTLKVWNVNFNRGDCVHDHFGMHYVRAVRGGQF